MEKRETNIDILRCLCIFAVVFIHTTANFMVDNYPSVDSKIIMILSIFTSCAVPLFYMLSGAFLIKDKNTDIKKVLRKTLHIYLQLILWTIIYQLMFKFIQHQDIDFVNVIIKSFTISQVGHLWFMYPLLGLYVLLPLITKLYVNLNDKQKRYLILILCIIPTIISTIKIKYNDIISLPYFSVGFPEIGLFVLGKYLYDKKEICNKKTFILSLLLIIVGFFLVKYISNFYIDSQGISHSKPYFDYNKLPNLMMIVGIFIIMINAKSVSAKLPIKLKKIINYIGANTLGIYFIHMIYIYLFPTIKIGKIYLTSNSGNFWNMLLGSLFYFAVSILSVLILNHIPILKKLVK